MNALADVGSQMDGPAFWVLLVIGLLIVAAMAVPADVWTRIIDRPTDNPPPHQRGDVDVACVHRDGRRHPAPRDTHGWHLCPRGTTFRITPLDTEEP